MLRFFFVLLLIPISGFAVEWNGVEFRSDGSAVFAVKDGKPVWSDDGLLFRERYTPVFERTAVKAASKPQPFRADVQILQKFGRLYVILEKTSEPVGGNVLVSLDLATEGKLVFRRDSDRDRTSRFVRFVSFVGDTLTVELADGATVSFDVATGAESVKK